MVSITSGNFVHRYECTLNEEKAAEKRDEIKKGFDDLKKELADFTGKWNTKKGVGNLWFLLTYNILSFTENP